MPSWFEITVEVPSELGEVVGSFLFDLGTPGLECSDHDGVTSLVAYFRDLPALDHLQEWCVSAGRRAGTTSSPVIRTRSIDEQDWAQDWKRHFQPTAVGSRLMICPPWNCCGPSERMTIVIEPGMAFGTGQHPTTRGCLQLIEDAVAARRVSRALDVGTGSGILSIALAMLGVGSVCAIDNDPVACKAAAENSERNGTEAAVHISDDWRKVQGHFDLLVANLFTNLLRDFAHDFIRRLAPHGVLVCSGFLASDEAAVIHAYPGFRTVGRRDEDGWVALSLSRRDP